MKDFERVNLIGVVFDLNAIPTNDGVRNIDLVKNVLLKKALDIRYNIYVSHPEWQTIPRDQGESTFCIISYKEPPKFLIDEFFKKAIMVIGEYKEDCNKQIFLITDRFQAPQNYQYRKGFLTNTIRGYGTKISVFGIGDQYDKITLQTMAEEYKADFKHISDLNNMEI